jgi:hypothetical protein
MEEFGFFLTRAFATTRRRRRKWPYVPGKYFVTDPGAPVAVTTLGSKELAEEVANSAPAGLCIVGKVETENIGIEKIIKNILSNANIRYLICAGNEPPKHLTGATIMALFENGMDEHHRFPWYAPCFTQYKYRRGACIQATNQGNRHDRMHRCCRHTPKNQ